MQEARYILGMKFGWKKTKTSRDELVAIHNEWIKSVSSGTSNCQTGVGNSYLIYDKKNPSLTDREFRHYYFIDAIGYWRFQNPSFDTFDCPYVTELLQDVLCKVTEEDREIFELFEILFKDFEIFPYESKEESLSHRFYDLYVAWKNEVNNKYIKLSDMDKIEEKSIVFDKLIDRLED